MIAAQQYYIEFSSDMNQERLMGLLPNYIPDYCLNSIDNTVEKWAQLVQQAFKKVSNTGPTKNEHKYQSGCIDTT